MTTATEYLDAFNKGLTSGRFKECYSFVHFHPFPNLVRETKHGNRGVPIGNDLRTRLALGWNSDGRTYN